MLLIILMFIIFTNVINHSYVWEAIDHVSIELDLYLTNLRTPSNVRVTIKCVTIDLKMCLMNVMTPFYVWVTIHYASIELHVCLTNVITPVICVRDNTLRDNSVLKTPCIHTHSYVWHDLFMCATWLIHVCDMTLSHVWQGMWVHRILQVKPIA